MGDRSAIEWTEATWNPVVGCTHVSAGCDRCYSAELTATRLAHVPVYAGLATKAPGEPGRFTGEVRCLPERLDQPFRWKRPRRIFVNSMSDLFHRDVPDAFIADVFTHMAAADWHTFQVLTKRPDRMAKWTGSYARRNLPVVMEPQPHIWLGTSIEDDRYTFRANQLRATVAAVRFLSLEPLLGPLPSLNLNGIDWVIVGGESGPGARPMHPRWARGVRDRCVAAGVPFFFKQWGEWAPGVPNPTVKWCQAPDGLLARVGKKAAGRELDGRTWDEMPTGAAA